MERLTQLDENGVAYLIGDDGSRGCDLHEEVIPAVYCSVDAILADRAKFGVTHFLYEAFANEALLKRKLDLA